MKYAFGVDIGGTAIKIGLFSHDEGLLEHTELPTPKGEDVYPALRGIKTVMEAILKKRNIDASLTGTGMAAPGPVLENGLLCGAQNIGWGNVYLAREAERLWNMPDVLLANDADAAALGECFYGAGQRAEDVLFISLGTGVGGGIIQGGKILTGKNGVAGEIGHMTVDPFETIQCTCGKKGCLEQYASATGMVRAMKEFLEKSQRPSALREDRELTAKLLWDSVKAGDPLAIEIAEYSCNYLGIAIANACYITDPELVIIGGGVSMAGEILIDMAKKSYQRQVFPHCRDRRIVLAGLGGLAGIYGCAAMVFKNN